MKKLLLSLLCLGMLFGCSSGNNLTSTNDSNQEEVTVDDPEELIQEVYNWYVEDIWNVGLCDVKWCLEDGTSSTGEELDIEFTMTNLKKSMEKLDEYNKQMNELSDDYKDIKYTWSKMYDEITRNYNLIKDKDLKAKQKIDGFNTDKLQQYHDKLFDQISEL